MEPGDYYMLGSLQIQLSKYEPAARSFEHEIELAVSSGADYFHGSSVIRLAGLKLKLNDLSRARDVLASVDDSAGDYLHGIGFRTKVDILHEIDLAEKGDAASA